MPDDPAHIVDLLDDLLDFFGPDGEQWRRFAYEDAEGNRCLVGAVELHRGFPQQPGQRHDGLPQRCHMAEAAARMGDWPRRQLQ